MSPGEVLAALRGALWAARRLRRPRARRHAGQVELAFAPPPPRERARGAAAGRGVYAVVRRASPTCLERAVVLQLWEAAQGRRRDVVVGVSAPSVGFRAHAWLEGEPDDDYEELFRRAAPAGSAGGAVTS